MPKIVITGAAGLVGQNLIARLAQQEGASLVAIDKHEANTALLRRLHPAIEVLQADLAQPGAWEDSFRGADAAVIAQAQIGGLDPQAFTDNNVTATRNIIAAMRRHRLPYFIHISSSVMHSQADDLYTRSKAAQEALIDEVTEIPHLILRPTLMFGWFDAKHLGWLRRFMGRSPLFPIPGRGEFIRQPLYVGDFCTVLISSLRSRKTGAFDISGLEQISYGDLIRLIHDTVQAKSLILPLPYPLFWSLLYAYGKLMPNPPFTTAQLEALVIPETFPVIDWPGIFGVTPTPLTAAIGETFLDKTYGGIALAR